MRYRQPSHWAFVGMGGMIFLTGLMMIGNLLSIYLIFGGIGMASGSILAMYRATEMPEGRLLFRINLAIKLIGLICGLIMLTAFISVDDELFGEAYAAFGLTGIVMTLYFTVSLVYLLMKSKKKAKKIPWER